MQKILARAGHGSRRSVEAMIAAGRVTVNGVPAQLGAQADVESDVIELDGTLVRPSERSVYLALNKPAGYVTTAHDPQGRRTVMELLPEGIPEHVLPIGRLDRDTDGLLLFSNDGEFTHRLTHPRFEVEKEYAALVEGAPTAERLGELERGVMIDDRRTAPARVESVDAPPGFERRDGHTWLRIVVHEGRKRQVRRMFASIGHPVRTLVRTRVDGIALGRLERGTARTLSDAELRAIRTLLGLPPARSPSETDDA